jgi:hypothetical protein
MSIEKILMGEGTSRRHYEVQLEENRFHTGQESQVRLGTSRTTSKQSNKQSELKRCLKALLRPS